MKNLIKAKIFFILALGILGCSQNSSAPISTNSVVGHWYYDLKASQSHANTKEEKYLLKSIVGEEMILDKQGNFYAHGKKVGSYKSTSNNQYSIKTKSGKNMSATHKNQYLIVKDSSNMGEFTLYFTQKNVAKNSKSITNYIHINQIYRQPKKIYDNGYLYYLFWDNGVMYSHVSQKTKVTKDEILKSGTKSKYKYVDNKIYIRLAMFTVTVEAKNKKSLTTSQGDRLVLQ